MSAQAIRHLGPLPGPLLVFGGPYSNLAATRALLSQATALNLDAGQVICTGDVVAYGAEAEQTCQLIRDSEIHVVMGNCEESLANDSDDCGCGFEEGMTCSVLSQAWYRHARSQVSPDSRQWMAGLPRAITFDLAGYRCRVIHGGVSQINRFIHASTDTTVKAREMQLADCDIIIAGHSGLPFGERIGAGAWLNAGAIGLPANDGTPAVWYLLITPLAQGLECRWRRLEYDFDQSHRSMLSAGLEDYAQTICNGLWPSMDTLPDTERNNRGKPLRLSPLILPGNG